MGLKQYERQARKWTTKLIDRLTYSPAKHKNKKVRELRAKLQKKDPVIDKPEVQDTIIKFGSFNVNGLDLEVGWAREQLLSNRGFDVNIIKNMT